MKKLNELYNCNYDVEIKGIKINSKEVVSGDIFVAIRGNTVDGHDYIEEAIKNGAVKIITAYKTLKQLQLLNWWVEGFRFCAYK